MRNVVRYRALGVAFIALMLIGVWFVNAVFTQRFTSFAKVRLDTDHIGLQLPAKADVKVRGQIVGQVLDVAPRAGGAVMTLGLDPDKIGEIPENVSASILPKTLFGEKYVSLVVPDNPSSTALAAGDLIKQTKLPIEVEKVLSDIYPLLRTVQPAEINYTLNALADALEGRGQRIGENIEILDGYLKRMNPQLPQLIADLKLLGTVSDTYADVFPDIAATLRNSVKTGNTLLGREARLRSFLRDTSAFSKTAKGFLDANGDNIITLGNVSAPTLRILATYAPEFPCMLGGIVKQADKLSETFRGFVFHIVVRTIPKQPRGYGTQDTPVYGDKRGPYCGTLPTPPYSPSNPKTSIPDFNDGVAGQLSRTSPGYHTTGTSAPLVIGTPAQKAMVTSIAAPTMNVPADRVGDVATLLFAPIANGSEVSVK